MRQNGVPQASRVPRGSRVRGSGAAPEDRLETLSIGFDLRARDHSGRAASKRPSHQLLQPRRISFTRRSALQGPSQEACNTAHPQGDAGVRVFRTRTTSGASASKPNSPARRGARGPSTSRTPCGRSDHSVAARVFTRGVQSAPTLARGERRGERTPPSLEKEADVADPSRSGRTQPTPLDKPAPPPHESSEHPPQDTSRNTRCSAATRDPSREQTPSGGSSKDPCAPHRHGRPNQCLRWRRPVSEARAPKQRLLQRCSRHHAISSNAQPRKGTPPLPGPTFDEPVWTAGGCRLPLAAALSRCSHCLCLLAAGGWQTRCWTAERLRACVFYFPHMAVHLFLLLA